jgi:diaminohydroxyphosphoribosylaminopyrimidine deaminase / 5-amino-6-(5-phosphoribosylamino)uracil reductase
MRSDQDDRLLARTLALAREGVAAVSPNPMVGALVVKADTIISEGFHARYGGPHAEVVALTAAGDAARGATLYCNLEPCSYEAPHKHQPPCVRAIVASGIRRVVIGQLDPNPFVRGSGVDQLRAAGIVVDVVDGDRFWAANEVFNTCMTLGRPFVRLKSAISLDGRIAAAGGRSKWISDESARLEVHQLRSCVDAVAVGIRTVIADDPLLTARLSDPVGTAVRQPRAVVFDTHLRVPPSSRLVRDRPDALVLLASRSRSDTEWDARRDALAARGVTVIDVPDGDVPRGDVRDDGAPTAGVPVTAAPTAGVPLAPALRALYEAGIASMLVEGGAGLLTGLVARGLYDRVTFYLCPLLLGAGVDLTGDLGVSDPGSAIRFEDASWRSVGGQQAFEARRAGWLDEVRGCAREADSVYRAG